MLITEFQTLTGFFPTEDLYRTIEKYYYDFDGDKVDFCKAYVDNTDGIAEQIRIKTDIDRRLRAHNMVVEIRRLTEELEREQEWKPFEDSTNVQQADYDELKASGKVWDDEEARTWIADVFGFDPEKIKIRHSVNVYEVNRHRMCRIVGEAERLPLYEASDWNYVRFDCGPVSYELSNGMLQFFRD